MTDLQKEFEATGYTSWINSNLYPDGKIYTQEYTEWLEKQVQALRIALVVREKEQLKAFVEWQIQGNIPYAGMLIDEHIKAYFKSL